MEPRGAISVADHLSERETTKFRREPAARRLPPPLLLSYSSLILIAPFPPEYIGSRRARQRGRELIGAGRNGNPGTAFAVAIPSADRYRLPQRALTEMRTRRVLLCSYWRVELYV